MEAITDRDAPRQFPELLDRAQAGEEVVITRGGVPIAKLVPVQQMGEEAERRRRIAELMRHLEEGALRGGIVADWTRDELYDRESDRRCG